MNRLTRRDRNLPTLCSFLLAAVRAFAQDKPPDPAAKPAPTADNAEALRKAAQNPIASLISVPIQENWNFNIGPADRTQNIMNIQPVIPLSAGKDWNLIIRWITPIIYQPVGVAQPPPQTGDVALVTTQAATGPATQSGVYGFGDMQPAFFLPEEKQQSDLGSRPAVAPANRHKDGHPRTGKIRHGPDRRGFGAARQMDTRISYE
jgi:hypothetical protein